MKGQRDSFDSIMVVIENMSTGEPVAQQVIKFTNPQTWSKESAQQWMQLVQKKFLTDGTIEPVLRLFSFLSLFASASLMVLDGRPQYFLSSYHFSISDHLRLLPSFF